MRGQESCIDHGEVASDLGHDDVIGRGMDAGDMHLSGREAHDDQHVDPGQSTERDHRHRAEIARPQRAPMRTDEMPPAFAPCSTLACWGNAALLQNVPDRLVADGDAEVTECISDTVIAPGRIVDRHLRDQLANASRYRWPSRLLWSFACFHRVGDQPPKPPAHRADRRDNQQRSRRLPTDCFGMFSDAASVRLGEDQPLSFGQPQNDAQLHEGEIELPLQIGFAGSGRTK